MDEPRNSRPATRFVAAAAERIGRPGRWFRRSDDRGSQEESAPAYELLDPASPEYQLVARFIHAAAERTGLQTRWNGRIEVDPDPDPWDRALAWPDGTLLLSETKVLAPLRKALAGEELSETDLDQLRDAAASVGHEGGHLVDRTVAPDLDRHDGVDPPVLALNEGLIELWMRDNLDDLIHDTGLDRNAPGLIGRETPNPYPAYTVATASLLEGLEPLTGKSPEELSRLLMGTDRSQRWSLLADLAIDHDLGDVQLSDRAGVREDLANSLRGRFAEAQQIHAATDLTPERKQQRAWHVGTSTAAVLATELDRVRETASTTARTAEPPGAEVNRLSGFLDGQAPASKAPGHNRSGSESSPGAGVRPGGARPETARSDGSRPDSTRSTTGSYGAARSPSRPGHTGPHQRRP